MGLHRELVLDQIVDDVGREAARARRLSNLGLEYWKSAIDLHGALEAGQKGLIVHASRQCLLYAIESVVAKHWHPFGGDLGHYEVLERTFSRSVAEQALSLLRANPRERKSVSEYGVEVMKFCEEELSYSPDAFVVGGSPIGWWENSVRDLSSEHAGRFMAALGYAGDLALEFNTNPTDVPLGERVRYAQEERREVDAENRGQMKEQE